MLNIRIGTAAFVLAAGLAGPAFAQAQAPCANPNALGHSVYPGVLLLYFLLRG